MGGPGSGRYPSIATREPKRTNPHVVTDANKSWRIVRATLAQAEQAVRSGEPITGAMLDICRWAIEMRDGKPTVKLDADVHSRVTLDPSLILQASRELEERRNAFMLSHNIQSPTCLSVPIEAEYSVSTLEEGCREECPDRYVSKHPQKIVQNESELNIKGEE